MTDWTAALHPTAAGMPPAQRPATITPQQGGYKISQPPDKIKAPPALKQPKPAVPFKPAKPVKQPAAAQKGASVNRTAKPKYPRMKPEDIAVGPEDFEKLSRADRRWVALESARFVTANRDTWDDSHELAVRAHNHAAVKTSTFTRQRSAAVCEAFVATVTKLGERQYRLSAEYPDDPRWKEMGHDFSGSKLDMGGKWGWPKGQEHESDPAGTPPCQYCGKSLNHPIHTGPRKASRTAAINTNFPDSLMFL